MDIQNDLGLDWFMMCSGGCRVSWEEADKIRSILMGLIVDGLADVVEGVGEATERTLFIAGSFWQESGV